MTTNLICKDCDASFSLSYDKQRWFLEQGLELPKRCDPCLARRREARAAEDMGYSHSATASSSDSDRWPVAFFQQESEDGANPRQTYQPHTPGRRPSALSMLLRPHCLGQVECVAIPGWTEARQEGAHWRGRQTDHRPLA